MRGASLRTTGTGCTAHGRRSGIALGAVGLSVAGTLSTSRTATGCISPTASIACLLSASAGVARPPTACARSASIRRQICADRQRRCGWRASAMATVTRRRPPSSSLSAADCLWCGTGFAPRRDGGKPQVFCRPACRRDFDAAGRRWVAEAIAASVLTVAALRDGAIPTRALLAGGVSPASLSVPQKPAPAAPAERPEEAARSPTSFSIGSIAISKFASLSRVPDRRGHAKDGLWRQRPMT